jgi:hypothetical protein
MADEATSTAPEGQEAGTEQSATDALGDGGKKALDAERREKRAAERRAADLEAKLKEFEDRDKSEAQKLAERAEAAERRVKEIESHAIRLEVAAEKGLTPAQAKRLVGSTREELLADADELLTSFAQQGATEQATTTSTGSLDLGTHSGSPMPLNGDPLERALRQHLGI